MNDSASVIDYSSTPQLARGNLWTQTGALLLDAYRDLQSRKLFWLTLVLSAGVALLFGSVGINEQGLKVFGRQLNGVPINSVLIPPADFYKLIFTSLAIPFWLGFLATILALVAVGGVFPDTISGGSIELYLSRPIGRLRLFLTKYAFGLLFTALQVLLFSTASFFIIGLRGGAWEFRIFLAIPLVTLLFSYLYCICVLVGIVTRSTLASILLTVMFWGALYAIHVADIQIVSFTAAADQRVLQAQRRVEFNEDAIAKNAALPEDKRGDMRQFEFQRDSAKAALEPFQQTADSLHWWQELILDIKTPLPKTNDTVALMSRWLLRPNIMSGVMDEERRREEDFRQRRGGPATRPGPELGRLRGSPEVQEQVQETLGARKVTWIIGTSLGFEAVVLALGAWVFCRRDY